VGALVNVVLLWLVNLQPGWQVLPFLTPAFTRTLGFVNASMVVSVIANVVYVIADPPWLRAVGDIAVTTVGAVAMVALWRVFPVAFPGQSFDWELVVRILLGLGLVGSVIAVVRALVEVSTRRWRR
jgi:hypothetical protein